VNDYPFLTLSKIILYILSAATFAVSVILILPAVKAQDLLGMEIPRALFLFLTLGSLGHSFLLAGAAELIKLFLDTSKNVQTMTAHSAEILRHIRKIEITTKYTGAKMVENDRR